MDRVAVALRGVTEDRNMTPYVMMIVSQSWRSPFVATEDRNAGCTKGQH